MKVATLITLSRMKLVNEMLYLFLIEKKTLRGTVLNAV